MRNRLDNVLKILCVGLAALLAVQCVRAVIRGNPLSKVRIPQVPSLASDTNAPTPAGGANTALSTSPSPGSQRPVTRGASTNSASGAELTTNSIGPASINTPIATGSTNLTASDAPSGKNALMRPVEGTDSTNQIALAAAGSTQTNSNNGSNTTAQLPVPPGQTPGSASQTVARTSSVIPGPVTAAMRSQVAGGGNVPALSDAMKARVDRIYESEILGQVMRPMPMGLLGIAGNFAMLRSDSGQTGLVKEGDALGDLKLLKIGINRVLVEKGTNRTELMIFNGYGGESLLSQTNATHDETTKK